jgi:hypothetical protein
MAHEWVLNREIRVELRAREVPLVAGSFIFPIEYKYVPEHVKRTDTGWWGKTWDDIYKAGDYTYCYTRLGIVLIETKDIRKIK